MADDINKLTELQTLRVSLVHRGANKRKFSIQKGEGDVMEEKVIEFLSGIMKDAQYDGEKPLMSLVEKQEDEKVKNAIMGAMRILNAFKENPVVAKLVEAMSSAMGYPKPKAAEKQKEKPEDEGEYPEPKKMAKSEESPELAAVTKALEDARAEAKEQIAKAEQRAQEAEKVAKAERDIRIQKEFVAKAETVYKAMPGKHEDLGALLKDTHDASAALGKRWEDTLAPTCALLEKSALLAEAGKSGDGSNLTDDPMHKILKAASEQKAE